LPCPRVYARVLAAERLFCPCFSYPAYHTSDFFSVPKPILFPLASLGEVEQPRTRTPRAERFTQNRQGEYPVLVRALVCPHEQQFDGAEDIRRTVRDPGGPQELSR